MLSCEKIRNNKRDNLYFFCVIEYNKQENAVLVGNCLCCGQSGEIEEENTKTTVDLV